MTTWRLLTRSITNNVFLSSSRPSARLVPRLYTLPRRHVSPFTKFFESIKTQVEENKEFQQNVKLLQEEKDKLAELEAMKKAKELYNKAKEGADATTSIGTEKIKASVDDIKKSAEKIGSTVSEAIHEVGGKEFVRESREKISSFTEKVSSQVSSTTEPLRQTKVYSTVRDSIKETVKDNSARYSGFIDKETRRSLREEAAREEIGKSGQRVAEDLNAGQAVVLHKDSKWKESWNRFKENNAVIQVLFRLKSGYENSDNVFISYSRHVTDSIGDTFGSFLAETETAQALSQLKAIDPSFNLDYFMREARQYIVPELIEAYLKGDTETLKKWCSEAAYNVLAHGFAAQAKDNLLSDCRVLDLRDVELRAARILDNDIPVLVITFSAQEVIMFRNRLTNEIVQGREDQIDQVTYACVLTKEESRIGDPVTNGWKVLDMAKSGSQKLIW
ncbi:11787_t:CDS:2 [Paraglomus brasilianum]|uniref:Mitochondrial import inner membrane translocase subunit TIM44 n=1 Tax=Paraglomus brasilianum TaxID=144538 RepID=A0A9N8WL98_9GLOM|nr:11787_t:CDS:2 [Paraglomus brasilianum]